MDRFPRLAKTIAKGKIHKKRPIRSHICNLPPELVLHVLSFVSPRTLLLRVSLISKDFHRHANDGQLWKEICRRFGYNIQRAHHLTLNPYLTLWKQNTISVCHLCHKSIGDLLKGASIERCITCRKKICWSPEQYFLERCSGYCPAGCGLHCMRSETCSHSCHGC